MVARQLKLSRSLWRRTLAGVAVALLLAAAAVVFADRARTSLAMARSSEALGLARLAVDKAQNDPQQAMMLALAAIATAPDDRSDGARTAESALVRAMAGKRTLAILDGHEDTVNAAVVSADGQRALTASADRTAILWDVTTATPQAVLRHPDAVMAAAFPADTGEVVTGSFYGDIKWWRLDDPAEPTGQFRIFAAEGGIFERFLAFERALLDTFGIDHLGLIDQLPASERARIQEISHGPEIVLGGISFPRELLDDMTISDIRFSANARYAVVTNLRGHAALWDLPARRRVLDLRKQEREAYFFSSDGRSVIAGEQIVELPEADPPLQYDVVAALGLDPSLPAFRQEPFQPEPVYFTEIKLDRTVHVTQRLPNPGEFTSSSIYGSTPDEGRIDSYPERVAISAGTYVSEPLPAGGKLVVRDLAKGTDFALPDIDPSDLRDTPQLSADGKTLTLLLGRSGPAVRVMRFVAGTGRWSVVHDEEIGAEPEAGDRQWMLSDTGSFVVEAWRDHNAADTLQVLSRPVGTKSAEGRSMSIADAPADLRIVGLSAEGVLLATSSSIGESLHRFQGGRDSRLQFDDLSISSSVKRIRFSEDGRTALLIGPGEIALYDVASASPLSRSHIHRGAVDAQFHPGGKKVTILLHGQDFLTWEPAIIARPLRQLACLHLPHAAGQPYWLGVKADPYDIRAKVETFCEEGE